MNDGLRMAAVEIVVIAQNQLRWDFSTANQLIIIIMIGLKDGRT